MSYIPHYILYITYLSNDTSQQYVLIGHLNLQEKNYMSFVLYQETKLRLSLYL